MANVLPLRWLGATRRAAVREVLDARLATWRHGWSRASSTPTLRDAEAGIPSLTWHVTRTASGSAAVGVNAAEAELGAALLGCSAAGAGDLPQRIGLRALRGLAQALAGGAAEPSQETRSTREIEPRAGGAVFQCRIDGQSIWIHVDASLCAVLAPVARSTPRAIMPRRNAIAPLATDLGVTLSLGHVALARLSSLRPGDVLQTSVRVGGLVQLTAADGTVARVGQLVADGEHRAIRIQ
jgi:hypothetical protein